MTSMNNKPLFLCTGSDRRQVYAAERLSRFAEVYTYNIDGEAEGARSVSSLEELPRTADLLLLPMPCPMNIPCVNGPVSCREFAGCLSKNAIVSGGKMATPVIEFFHSQGFDTADYLRREELAVKNSVPTAEGALALAMRELDVTVSGSSVLICGWGRVAKACAAVFKAVGAKTCIAARKTAQLAEAECFGHKGIELSRLSEVSGGFRLIINTVPALVVTEPAIENTRRDCLIIDLASQPGGVDFSACRRLGRKAVHALSLPGKCAPVTAGEIIAETVLNIYHERSGSNVT